MTFFKQLFDPATWTYTYILADTQAKEAVIIDSVLEQVERDLALLHENGLTLVGILETHVHADHITGASQLREATGAKTYVSRHGGAPCADYLIDDGFCIAFGNERIQTLATPGHTAGCVSYLWRDRVFTGDALLIDGCGRTDFQSGNAALLYDSIYNKIFSLPDETLIYPGHDYKQRYVSSVAEQKQTNPRLAGKTKEEFIVIMNALNLPHPKRIAEAVPANQQCGRV